MLSTALKSKLAKQHLLVADAPQMISLLESYLRDMGAKTIYRATDGRAAIEALNTPGMRISAVIYDMNLPRLDGLEALKLVRRNFGRLPFLMLSANVTKESIAAAAKLNVDGYLAKPFTVQQMERRIVGLMRATVASDDGAPEAPTEQAAEADAEATDDTWSI